MSISVVIKGDTRSLDYSFYGVRGGGVEVKSSEGPFRNAAGLGEDSAGIMFSSVMLQGKHRYPSGQQAR